VHRHDLSELALLEVTHPEVIKEIVQELTFLRAPVPLSLVSEQAEKVNRVPGLAKIPERLTGDWVWRRPQMDHGRGTEHEKEGSEVWRDPGSLMNFLTRGWRGRCSGRRRSPGGCGFASPFRGSALAFVDDREILSFF
jgi:hypothetical protein